jgi:hypothetical protein
MPTPAPAITIANISLDLSHSAPKTLQDGRDLTAHFIDQSRAVYASAIPNSPTANAASEMVRLLSVPFKTLAQCRNNFDNAREIANGKKLSGTQQPARVPSVTSPAAAPAPAIAIPAAPPTDAQILATYETLLGSQRKAFLAQHAEALWRAYRATARAKLHNGGR